VKKALRAHPPAQARGDGAGAGAAARMLNEAGGVEDRLWECAARAREAQRAAAEVLRMRKDEGRRSSPREFPNGSGLTRRPMTRVGGDAATAARRAWAPAPDNSQGKKRESACEPQRR